MESYDRTVPAFIIEMNSWDSLYCIVAYHIFHTDTLCWSVPQVSTNSGDTALTGIGCC